MHATDDNLERLCRWLTSSAERGLDVTSAEQRDGMVSAAVRHGLDGVLYRRLTEAEAPPDAALLPGLKARTIDRAKLSLLQEAGIARLAEHLRARGFPFLLIKGTPLAYLYYGSPAERPRADADLLIAEQDALRVRASLVAVGYRCEPLITPLHKGRYLTTQFMCRLAGNRSGCVFDIHWRVNNATALAALFSFQELMRDSIPVPALGPHVRTPGPAFSLLIACIHWTGEPVRRLVWLYDLHLLNEHMDSAHWRRVLDFAEQRRCASLLSSVLGQAMRWFDTPFPAEMITGLRSLSLKPPKEKTAPLAKPAVSHLRRRWIDFRVLDWRQRWLLLSTLCLPPRSYMALQDTGTEDISAARLIRRYLERPFRTLFAGENKPR